MTDPLTAQELIIIGVPAIGFTTGLIVKAVGWSVKRELNGSAEKIKDIHSSVKYATRERGEIKDAVHSIDTRLVRVETLVRPEQ